MALLWKHLGPVAGLGLAIGLAAACSEPESLAPTYAGTCPVLVECAAQLNISAYPAQDMLAVYGDPEGDAVADSELSNCWAGGLANHDDCRQSCIDTLLFLNLEAAISGRSCGECTSDGDCAEFGDDATCADGLCARPEIGDLDLSGASSTTGDGDGDASTGDDTDDPQAGDLPLDEACDVDEPRVAIETSLGTMVFAIDRASEPDAADLFMGHVSADFYDGSLVHRVVAGAFIEAGGFGPGYGPLNPLAIASYSGTPVLGHGADTLALSRIEDTIGAGFYLVDPPGPDAPAGVPIGTLVEGGEVRDAIAELEVFDFPWMGFILLDVPATELTITEVRCE